MSILWQLRSILRKNDAEAESKTTVTKPEKAAAGPVERRNRKRLNSHKGRRILIVDDSPTIIAALKKILLSAGCVTFEAEDAEAGLELLRKEMPDLVFLDIVLPGMNGFAALRLMRRDPQTQNIPVIMISGNEQATEQFYAKRIGADDFMKKPFSRHEVFARIESLVDAGKLVRLKAADPVPKPSSTTGPLSVSRVSSQAVTSTPPAAKAAKPVETAPVVAEAPQATQPFEPAAAPGKKTSPSALEARMQLTAMGLQYYSQEQFMAAIERGDALAIELFMIGGGVNTDA
jgi:twitching motility two-component system response regulator PilH